MSAKLTTREIQSIQRSIARKLIDLDDDELPILQHFLVYLHTNGEAGFNPLKPSWSTFWRILNYNNPPHNWSYEKFRGRGKKAADFAREIDDKCLTGT